MLIANLRCPVHQERQGTYGQRLVQLILRVFLSNYAFAKQGWRLGFRCSLSIYTAKLTDASNYGIVFSFFLQNWLLKHLPVYSYVNLSHYYFMDEDINVQRD